MEGGHLPSYGSIGAGGICHVCYLTVIWCTGFPEICSIRGWGQSVMKVVQCGLPEIYAQLEEGPSGKYVHFDMGICAFCYI